jgi:hypothetical protein
VLDLRAVFELLEQRHQALVDDHRAIAGVVGDVREVVRVQAQVQRVQYEAARRDSKVRLQVLVVVPAERRHAVAALEPELLQRGRELLCTRRHFGIRVVVEALVRQTCRDLLGAEVRLGAPQHRRQRQLEVHHLPVHYDPFPKDARRAMSASSTMWPSRST